MLGIGQGILGIGAFKQRLPRPEEALPGRDQPLPLHSNQHFVNSHPLKDRFAGLQQIRCAGLLLGRRAQVLDRTGRVQHLGRLCRRHHPEPDL